MPSDRLYALRHGVTGKIWQTCSGGRWLWNCRADIKRSWDILKDAGLVSSEFEEHVVVEIGLQQKP